MCPYLLLANAFWWRAWWELNRQSAHTCMLIHTRSYMPSDVYTYSYAGNVEICNTPGEISSDIPIVTDTLHNVMTKATFTFFWTLPLEEMLAFFPNAKECPVACNDNREMYMSDVAKKTLHKLLLLRLILHLEWHVMPTHRGCIARQLLGMAHLDTFPNMRLHYDHVFVYITAAF